MTVDVVRAIFINCSPSKKGGTDFNSTITPHETSLNTGRLYSTGLCIEPYTFRLKSGVSQVVWLLWREKSGSLLWEPQKTVLTYCLNHNCFEDLLTKEIMKPDTVSNKESERQQNRITLIKYYASSWMTLQCTINCGFSPTSLFHVQAGGPHFTETVLIMAKDKTK